MKTTGKLLIGAMVTAAIIIGIFYFFQIPSSNGCTCLIGPPPSCLDPCPCGPEFIHLNPTIIHDNTRQMAAGKLEHCVNITGENRADLKYEGYIIGTCGSEHNVFATISAKVFLNGQEVPEAEILFSTYDDSRTSYGTFDFFKDELLGGSACPPDECRGYFKVRIKTPFDSFNMGAEMDIAIFVVGHESHSHDTNISAQSRNTPAQTGSIYNPNHQHRIDLYPAFCPVKQDDDAPVHD